MVICHDFPHPGCGDLPGGGPVSVQWTYTRNSVRWTGLNGRQFEELMRQFQRAWDAFGLQAAVAAFLGALVKIALDGSGWMGGFG